MFGRTEKKATLKFVNTIRTGYGLEPLSKLPKGTRLKPGECVIARALDGIGTSRLVGPSSTKIFDNRLGIHTAIENPHEVSQFITRFDIGLHPTLISRN